MFKLQSTMVQIKMRAVCAAQVILPTNEASHRTMLKMLSHGLAAVACRGSLKTWLLLEEVEPLLAEGGLGPAAGLGTMRPSTGASVVAPAAIIDFTHPSPA